MKEYKIERCEQCPQVDFAGNNGKNVTCKITNRVVPDINKRPRWCPLTRGKKGKLSYIRLIEE